MSYAFSGLFENLLKKIYLKKLLKILNVLFTTRDITYLYILKFFHGPRYVWVWKYMYITEHKKWHILEHVTQLYRTIWLCKNRDSIALSL